VAIHRVEIPAYWTPAQTEGLRFLLEQNDVDADWDGDVAFTCRDDAREQALSLMSYLEGKDELLDPWVPPPPSSPTTLVAIGEVQIAGRGLRLAGWIVNALVFAAIGIALWIVGVSPWPRWGLGLAMHVFNDLMLVGLIGATVGNLAVRTRVVLADDEASVPGVPRAALRWAVVVAPGVAFALVGLRELCMVWPIVVFGPILFTPRRQGLHDLAASVVVIRRR
jgi:RDD family